MRSLCNIRCLVDATRASLTKGLPCIVYFSLYCALVFNHRMLLRTYFRQSTTRREDAAAH